MVNDSISKKSKVILLGLLVLLNIVLRLPSIPHEKGRDSFFIHSLANSINAFGTANWWEHWLSIFGYFPYSYASGLPFTLSGMSQLLHVDIEMGMLIYSFIFGVLSMFFAFSLAGVIYNNFIFKYAMALFFSLSPGIMLFTTWEASARGPFIIFLPLLFFLLLSNLPTTKKILLVCPCLIFLFSLHHYAIFALVLTCVYVFLHLSFKLALHSNLLPSLDKYTRKINYLYIFVLLASFMYPFLRFIGIIAFLTVGGVVSLSFTPKKNFPQWYILISMILMVPFLYDLTYGMYLLLLYSIIFLSFGFANMVKSGTINKQGSIRIVSVFIICLLLISTVFTGFYNHNRTGDYSDLWYMTENNYDLANWINNNIDKDSRVFMLAENNYIVRTIALQENGSSILVGGVTGLAYGFINDSYLDNLERVPATSSYFYSEGPYRVEERDIYKSMDWYVLNKDFNTIKRVYSLNFLVQSRTYYKRVDGLTSNVAEIIYSNGVHDVYKF